MRRAIPCLLLLAAACGTSRNASGPDPEPAPAAEREAGIAVDRSADSVTDERPAPRLSEAERREFERIWKLYAAGDPRWPYERDRFAARGEGPAWLLASNLIAHYMRINARRSEAPRALVTVKKEIVAVGGPAAPPLVDLMVLDRIPVGDDRWFVPDDITRQDCMVMLEEMGADAVAPLLRALEREDLGPKGRRLTALALGGTGDPRAFDPLVRLLREDSSWQVRADAATGLARLGDARALGPLEEAVKTDPDPAVVRRAGKARYDLVRPR